VPAFDLTVWNAIAAPKGTPADIVARLEAALAKALVDANVKARFTDLAAVAPSPPEAGGAALGRLIAADVERLGRLVESAGIKPE
jgi:tripartite-type tricarboxylate transporter receptor subunit TctC